MTKVHLHFRLLLIGRFEEFSDWSDFEFLRKTIKKKIIGRAVVKMVQSGDQITVRSKPQGGPPKEKVILFSNLTSGKPARRANPNILDSTDTGDEPYAWTARENLRKKIIGQEVYFEVSEEMAGRSYGTVWLGNNTDGENLTAWSLQTGNSVLRESVRKQVDRLQSQVGEDGEESEVKNFQNLVNPNLTKIFSN